MVAKGVMITAKSWCCWYICSISQGVQKNASLICFIKPKRRLQSKDCLLQAHDHRVVIRHTVFILWFTGTQHGCSHNAQVVKQLISNQDVI